jgi:hypothetical protein
MMFLGSMSKANWACGVGTQSSLERITYASSTFHTAWANRRHPKLGLIWKEAAN